MPTLPDPEIIAAEIVEDLQAALNPIRSPDLGGRDAGNELGTGTEKFAVPNRLVPPPELSSRYGTRTPKASRIFRSEKLIFIARATRRA